MLDCLDAAQEAGGDRRGQQSASLLVVERDGGYTGLSDSLVDLRVDDHERPIEELRRIFEIHKLLFFETPRDQWLDVDDALADELRTRLAKLGYDGELEPAFTVGGHPEPQERVDGSNGSTPSCPGAQGTTSASRSAARQNRSSRS